MSIGPRVVLPSVSVRKTGGRLGKRSNEYLKAPIHASRPRELVVTDTVSKRRRSELMARIPQKDTSPELTVRRRLHALGYRYTLHPRTLPGRPDLVFPSRMIAIFVHGCFWHAHSCEHGRRRPGTNAAYWKSKGEENRRRDRRKSRQLRQLGWRAIVVWECQVKRDRWLDRVRGVLDAGTKARTRRGRK